MLITVTSHERRGVWYKPSPHGQNGLAIWRSAISHLPWCFCPWTFFQNVGFNMVPSDPLMSHLATQLGYSAGGVSGFPTDPWGVWCRGSTTCLLHVGPPFGNRLLNNSWAVGLTQWIVYHFFFCILTYAIVYVLVHHIIFRLYLNILNNVLYFFKYTCTNISIDAVFILSIHLWDIKS